MWTDHPGGLSQRSELGEMSVDEGQAGSSARIEYEVVMPFPSMEEATSEDGALAGSFANMTLHDGVTCLSVLLRAGSL